MRPEAILLALLLACVASAGKTGKTGSVKDVEHVVIFMQENRSFDYYFGMLKGVRGFDDRAVIPLPNGKSVWHQPVKPDLGEYMLPFHVDTLNTNGMCSGAPDMSYPVDIAMWNEGRLDSWNTAREPGFGMGYYNRSDIPFYYELADAFTICDSYYQSTFTETNPNRLHLFSGSNGLSAGEAPILDNTEPDVGFNWTTVAEVLQEAGVTWKVYQEIDNFDDNGFAWFHNFRVSKPGDALYDRGMAISTDLVAAFQEDVNAGTLPQVSWIIAPADLSEHADHHPAAGEDLTARLLKALSSNSTLYSTTVFILNYDEGGQFFDHAWTPTPPVSADDGMSTVSTQGEVTAEGRPIGLGFRVPLIAISPWSRGGFVNSEVFDHTSVIKFLEVRFGVHVPTISPWRRAVVGDLTSVFDFAHPDYSWPPLPDTAGYVDQANRECSLPSPAVPKNQTMPTQEVGTKPARPIAYNFRVNGAVLDSKFMLQIYNTCPLGAVFYLYNSANATQPPRKYTVESFKNLSDSIPLLSASPYELTLFGPNGFVRQFSAVEAGPAALPVGIDSTHDTHARSLRLVLTNQAPNPVCAHVANGAAGVGTFVLLSGTPVKVPVPVDPSHWYDVEVQFIAASNVLGSAAGGSGAPLSGGALLGHARLLGKVEAGVVTITEPRTRRPLVFAAAAAPADHPPLLRDVWPTKAITA
mmetsp:Transcript_12855/g.32792  ORF Transcript_12855/g.32792 Transcript_12855/m.32792 type:complete len:694 (-) Transcript_12855:212-2293(-)